MRKIGTMLVGVVCWATFASAQTAEGPGPSIDLQRDVRIPMHDGVALSAVVYRPHGQLVALPTIVMLTPYTPYNTDVFHSAAISLARHGYVAMLVDSRGRGNSDGVAILAHAEPRDGADVVRWAAQQPWSNGRVAMRGGSYSGFNQWATAKEFPRGLATIVPTASSLPGFDAFWHFGMTSPYMLRWLTLVSGRTADWSLFQDQKFWGSKERALYDAHLPFEVLDSVAGVPSTLWRRWIAHPGAGAYWDSLTPSPAQFRQLDIPILTITGHFDAQNTGAMEYYRRHMLYGSEAAKAKHYLVIGPWDHDGTRSPKPACCRFTFGPAALVDINRLHEEWYDWTMKDGRRPALLKDRVAYYAVGPEEWRYAPSLAAIPVRHDTLFLGSTGSAGNLASAGTLRASNTDQTRADRYFYDPLVNKSYDPGDTTATNLGLVYLSEPMSEDVQLTGAVRLTMSVALNVPDTDFEVWMSEIMPDGKAAWWISDQQRARYRISLHDEQLVTPGRIEAYQFMTFPWVSLRIREGSRIRLEITTPNRPSVQKNYNSGGVVAKESANDAQRAVVEVFHNLAHPSFLVLPLERSR